MFRLSAEVLRMAGGQVRCGKCGEVFNALARLAEEPGAFAVGESAFELETRADHILESAPPGEPGGSPEPTASGPETEIAHLEVEDWEDDPDELEGAALEFTLPPGELDRIFVEDRQTLKFLAESAAGSRSSGRSGDAARFDSSPSPDSSPPPDLTPPPDSPGADEEGHGHADVADVADVDADFIDTDVSAEQARAGTPSRRSGDARAVAAPRATSLDLSEELRREVEAGIEQANIPAFLEPRTPSMTWWLVGAFIGAVLLAAQVIHQNRQWLAAHEPFAEPLRAFYAAIGYPLPAPLNLSVYQLRQWGVTGDPGADGTLRVRASILNVAAALQPYPQLRVTLADRFGNRIGSRDFDPGEYLARPPARLMAPGERADATLEIQDPGRNAEGFEFDVCLRSAEQRVVCANDALAHPR